MEIRAPESISRLELAGVELDRDELRTGVMLEDVEPGLHVLRASGKGTVPIYQPLAKMAGHLLDKNVRWRDHPLQEGFALDGQLPGAHRGRDRRR